MGKGFDTIKVRLAILADEMGIKPGDGAAKGKVKNAGSIGDFAFNYAHLTISAYDKIPSTTTIIVLVQMTILMLAGN